MSLTLLLLDMMALVLCCRCGDGVYVGVIVVTATGGVVGIVGVAVRGVVGVTAVICVVSYVGVVVDRNVIGNVSSVMLSMLLSGALVLTVVFVTLAVWLLLLSPLSLLSLVPSLLLLLLLV